MDIGVFIIAGIGIIGFAARTIVKIVMDADIRKLELQRSARSTESADAAGELELLRAEIARLRDTTTEHAISLQHTVERLDQRVEFLEKKSANNGSQPLPTAPREANQQQIIGR